MSAGTSRRVEVSGFLLLEIGISLGLRASLASHSGVLKRAASHFFSKTSHTCNLQIPQSFAFFSKSHLWAHVSANVWLSLKSLWIFTLEGAPKVVLSNLCIEETRLLRPSVTQWLK